MTNKNYLGWVRDATGLVVSRPVKTISNAITTMCGGGHTDPKSGMGQTVPYVMYEYK